MTEELGERRDQNRVHWPLDEAARKRAAAYKKHWLKDSGEATKEQGDDT